ncbi:VacJ family lipoprotein [Marinobacter sp.]|uniref:MlaA family lipoprotein n=1 Tax=Marinobacter sp. TaxID=50741 RepID=UPI00199ACBAB|nr:VacJ family lipoprotein [Marinobacter sp.]MBC7191000.1 VacJ family lipoprotein [Marinobacter sp.]
MSRFGFQWIAFALLVAFTSSAVVGQTVENAPPEGAPAVNPEDPYENWNRKVFAFNQYLDDWVLRPVARAYRFVTPDIVDHGVTNFFNNLGEIRNFANSVFQLKAESAVVAAGRFTYNTVFGLGGLIDVGTAFGLPERSEDFGQTLGYWGVGTGPYLMMPLLGPATPRRLAGLGTDGWVLPSAWDEVGSPEEYYLRAVELVDKRADLIPAESFMSGDRYTFVRNAYLQRREFLVQDGKVHKDPFAADDEDLMLEDF